MPKVKQICAYNGSQSDLCNHPKGHDGGAGEWGGHCFQSLNTLGYRRNDCKSQLPQLLS